MIEDPIRSAFEHIDEDASDEFRDALHAKLLAELVGDDTSGQDEPSDVVTLVSSDAESTSSRRWLITIAAAAVVLMLVGTLTLVARDDASDPQVPAAPPAVPSGGSGLIALAGRSGESGSAEIYVVAPDGTGLRALTSTPGVSEMAPAWSPDGTRLAFLRDVRLGGGELVVIDPATGDETFSADIPNPSNTDVLPPEWSPDGRLIVINLSNCPCFMMVDLETGTWTTNSNGFVRGWSPDGKWFAFHSVDEGLFLVPADLFGTTDLDDVPNLPGVRLLVESGGLVTWMPDSSAAAIEGADGLEVVTIADGQRRTLTEDGFAPSWSPDGSHVAYVRCTPTLPGGSVWVSTADGTGARAVARSLVAPSWSPGGRLLTLVDSDGVFTVRPDGTGMTQLAQVTRTGGSGPFDQVGACEGDNQFFRPVWQPGATEAPHESVESAESVADEGAGTRVGFIGLPPEGATPSTPEGEEIVVSIHSCPALTGELSDIDVLPPLRALWVLADGRLIWLKYEDLPEGANSLSTGLLEQRLTPEGVELMRSEATAAVSSGEPLEVGRCDPRDYIISGRGLEGNAFSADDEHLARVIDPWSWLPATAWEDPEIRAYVPFKYLVMFGRLRSASPEDRPFPRDQLAFQLPAAAMEVIDTKKWRENGGVYYATFTTDEARALTAALDDAGLEQDGLLNAYQLDYQFEWHGDPPAVAGHPPVPDTVVHIMFSGFAATGPGCEGWPNLCLPSL